MKKGNKKMQNKNSLPYPCIEEEDTEEKKVRSFAEDGRPQ